MAESSVAFETPELPGRKNRTRAALIRAAEQLMAKRSVDAVTIDEIVEEAKVAKGSFYNHFPDKETLQQAALEQIRRDIRAEIDRWSADVRDPARHVAQGLCVVLRYALEHPVRGNFLLRTFMVFQLVEGRMNDGLLQILSTGLREGRFRFASVESAALLNLGIVQGALVQTLQSDQLFSTTARAQQLGAMMLRAYGLDGHEAELISAQECDRIVCGHGAPGASPPGPVSANHPAG